MLPLKTYKFVDITHGDVVQITIKAYNFTEAMENLVELTKHPADYKAIEM